MGKLYDEYMTRYMEGLRGVSPAEAKKMAVAKPAVWILAAWEIDNGLEGPWQTEHRQKFKETSKKDPELGKALAEGMQIMLAILQSAEENGDG